MQKMNCIDLKIYRDDRHQLITYILNILRYLLICQCSKWFILFSFSYENIGINIDEVAEMENNQNISNVVTNDQQSNENHVEASSSKIEECDDYEVRIKLTSHCVGIEILNHFNAKLKSKKHEHAPWEATSRII